MDGTDIGNMPNPNAQSNYEPANVPSSPSSTPAAPGQVDYDQNASTISKSDQEKLLEELFIMMQSPWLFPPALISKDLSDLVVSGNNQAIDAASNSSAVTRLAILYEQTKNDIITSMWENFSKGVQEMEELSKKAYIKKWVEDVSKEGPKSGTEYYAYLLALSSSNRADELTKNGDGSQSGLAVQFNASFDQWFSVSNVADSSANTAVTNGTLDSSFKVGTLASNPDIVREAVSLVALAGATQFSVNPLADAATAVGPNTGLPVDSQAAGALIAALLYGGAKNKADVETLEEAANKGQPPQDMEFAMNFAKNILAIVAQSTEKDASTGKEQAGQNQMVRLMLSVMALNLVYRAGYGGMEGKKEFADLLKAGGTDDIDPALKPTIDSLVARIKQNLPTDEPSYSRTMASLSEYIDSKDSVESMLETTRMFAASLKASPNINHGRLGATSA